ncbi:MAG: serine/threonine protein kinase [Gemmataceae bacterium]|nr:serine/threonine protein kinase [Gemmataceae bacterium]
MTQSTPCPDLKELQRLLLGLMPDREATQLARHVKMCGHCLGAMTTLDADDTLVLHLREAARVAPPSNPHLQQVSASELNLPTTNGPSTAEYVVPTPAIENPGPLPLATKPDSAPAPAIPAPPVVAPATLAMLAPPQAPGEIGRLGPYRIQKVLGAGAMGIVFQAEDQSLQRVVAVKAMKPEAATGEQAHQRFLREARAAAALEHEHVVTIYQVGEDRGVPYLAMQMLRGETLDDRLRREHKLSVRDALRIAREIAAGLAAAHERGLVHRDIKPANIWLEAGRGRVKIVDFGLARAVGDNAHLTRSGTVVGTPAFMSPEQARGAPVDFRSDLFSLGSVLYHMVAGVLPFQGDDTMQVLLALAYEQPEALRRYNSDAPNTLVVLVNRLLAKHPDGRPESTQVVVEALEIIERDLAPTTAVAPPPASNGSTCRGVLPALAVLGMLLGMVGYWYAPEALRYVGNRGRVILASNDPGLEVIVKRNDVVEERTANREFELTAGHYEIEVADRKDQWTVVPKRFTLERNGRVLVEVVPNRKSPPK